jgi:hypothetical protein
MEPHRGERGEDPKETTKCGYGTKRRPSSHFIHHHLYIQRSDATSKSLIPARLLCFCWFPLDSDRAGKRSRLVAVDPREGLISLHG